MHGTMCLFCDWSESCLCGWQEKNDKTYQISILHLGYYPFNPPSRVIQTEPPIYSSSFLPPTPENKKAKIDEESTFKISEDLLQTHYKISDLFVVLSLNRLCELLPELFLVCWPVSVMSLSAISDLIICFLLF
jgi:hypothetical protein